MNSLEKNTESAFESALSGYAERAQANTKQISTKAMLGYTAAAGGLAFAGGDAMGAVVHNATPTTFNAGFSYTNTAGTFATGSKTFNLDIDGAGGPDLKFDMDVQVGYSPTSVFSWNFLVLKGYGETGSIALTKDATFNRGFALNLTTQQTVGSGLSFITGRANIFTTFSGSTRSGVNFTSGQTGYLGVKFDGDTGTVGTQYGWLKVRFDVTAPTAQNPQFSASMTILESAFDNCGDAIQVGATSGGSDCSGGGSNNVDSPATPLLALLGLGAAGVTTYRRRRQSGIERLMAEENQTPEQASTSV